jgi:transcriptional regulator GlxA family with amidase domain
VTHAGQTPARMVRQARLEAAATALVTTDQRVASIGKATGFRSGETLRQAFSGWFGISPTQYRKVHRRSASGPNRLRAEVSSSVDPGDRGDG